MRRLVFCEIVSANWARIGHELGFHADAAEFGAVPSGSLQVNFGSTDKRVKAPSLASKLRMQRPRNGGVVLSSKPAICGSRYAHGAGSFPSLGVRVWNRPTELRISNGGARPRAQRRT